MDLRVLHITDHAAKRYCQRVDADPRRSIVRAKGCIAELLQDAQPLPAPESHDGFPQKAWQLRGCVAIEKAGAVTTILTQDMYARGLRSDT